VRVSIRAGSAGADRTVGATRPLLLLNGIGAPLETWEPLRDRLAHRTTVAFDVPGTGGSPVSWFPTAIPGLARVLGALLDDLGIERSDVLGYSFGGAVAQEFARVRPARVGSLVLAATNCGWGAVPGDPLALAALVAPIPVHLLPPGHGSLLALSGDPGTRAYFSRADTAWAARPPNPLGVWWQALAIGTWTSAPWLHRITAPTLVLTGADDRVVPSANARMLARGVPNATLCELPHAGHFALLADDPGPSADAIEAFLLAQDPSAHDGPDQIPGLATT